MYQAPTLIDGMPQGWRILHDDDPFNRTNGPFFSSVDLALENDEPARVGLFIRAENCNMNGACHGGMISTALDIALGHSVQVGCGTNSNPTITLTVDFMRAGLSGEWLESRTRLLRVTRSVAFCDGVLIGPSGTVARASGIFKLYLFPVSTNGTDLRL